MSYHGYIGAVTVAEREVGVFYIEWDIPDFLSLATAVGDHYNSSIFDTCDRSWWLKMYPNGMKNLRSGYCDLLLIRIDSGVDNFSITAGIRAVQGVQNRKKVVQEISPDNYLCSWFRFCPRSELKRLLKEKNLIISLEMKMAETRDVFTQTVEAIREAPIAGIETSEKKDTSTQAFAAAREDPAAEVLSSEKIGVEELQKSLHGLLVGGEGSDCVLKVRGKEFPAHRAILRARSPVFRAMFSHDILEMQSGDVTIRDCDPESFPAFLEHVYTGSTQMISADNVFHLYGGL